MVTAQAFVVRLWSICDLQSQISSGTFCLVKCELLQLTPTAAATRRAGHALLVRFGCLTSSNRSALSLLRLSSTANNAVDKSCRSHFVR